MNDYNRFSNTRNDNPFESNRLDENKLDRLRKRRAPIVPIIVAGVLLTVLLVSVLYSYLVPPVDEFKLKAGITNNYTMVISAYDYNYVVEMTVQVDGNKVFVKSPRRGRVYYEIDGDTAYVYERWDQDTWHKQKTEYNGKILIGDDEEDALNIEELLDSGNYHPRWLYPFVWVGKGNGNVAGLRDVKVRRAFGGILITADFYFKSNNFKIRFNNVGSTTVELPEAETWG